ncbi:hypothetical protein V8G54_003806 [Vigna mungo]|uniref:Uncharacterized protein n=1 Tax=Vigna mungo TaxID=3915 RepID=A0AAQ3SC32_VIGMU
MLTNENKEHENSPKQDSWCGTDFSQSRPPITDPNGQNEEPYVWNLLSKTQLDPMVNDFTMTKTPMQIGKLGGVVVGMAVTVDVFIAGPVSGASMNPARSLGPALVMNVYTGFWVYIVGPFVEGHLPRPYNINIFIASSLFASTTIIVHMESTL